MKSNQNFKVVGAFLIGFALVFGAHTLSTFGQPRLQQPAAVAAATVVPRIAIEVTDNDGNGIEDWRDAFVDAAPVILDEAVSVYVPPETLSGQIGVTFLQDLIQSRSGGPFSRTEEEIISDTVANLEKETASRLFGIRDITVLNTWTDLDIKNYANAMAGAVERNNVAGLENELYILRDVLTRNQVERLDDLKILAGVYERTRDDSLAVPVPAIFVKQHLDLINTYQAIYTDVTGMTLSIEDPAYALLRIKRYEDDVLGLRLALENMYTALEPYASLFSANDAAVFFVSFSPNNQAQ